jgi:hypothetical protein
MRRVQIITPSGTIPRKKRWQMLSRLFHEMQDLDRVVQQANRRAYRKRSSSKTGRHAFFNQHWSWKMINGAPTVDMIQFVCAEFQRMDTKQGLDGCTVFRHIPSLLRFTDQLVTWVASLESELFSDEAFTDFRTVLEVYRQFLPDNDALSFYFRQRPTVQKQELVQKWHDLLSEILLCLGRSWKGSDGVMYPDINDDDFAPSCDPLLYQRALSLQRSPEAMQTLFIQLMDRLCGTLPMQTRMRRLKQLYESQYRFWQKILLNSKIQHCGCSAYMNWYDGLDGDTLAFGDPRVVEKWLFGPTENRKMDKLPRCTIRMFPSRLNKLIV